MKSAKRFSFVPFPRRPRDSKARNALRKVLASKVWAITDPEAYANELAVDFQLEDNAMNTAEQQQAQISTDHGNNQRSDRQEHAR